MAYLRIRYWKGLNGQQMANKVQHSLPLVAGMSNANAFFRPNKRGQIKINGVR
jgi:hypothetical protein